MKSIALLFLLSVFLLTPGYAQSLQDNFHLPLAPDATISSQIASISVLGRALTPEEELALGVLNVLEVIEGLSQSWYIYGLGQGSADDAFNTGSLLAGIPAPVSPNPEPKTISYEDFRDLLDNSISQLKGASKQLSFLDFPEDSKLVININELSFDINGNQAIDDGERVGLSLAMIAGASRDLESEDSLGNLAIGFDQGDVHWLAGYSNLLMAFFEIILAHDSSELFNSTAHLFFPEVESPYSEILDIERNLVGLSFEDDTTLVDAIALLHFVLRVPLLEPERLTSALSHAQEVTKQSKLMWKAIQAETDNDNEWIPNANQDSAIGITVDQAQIDSWLGFVNDAEHIWQGKLLIPHWRVMDGKGINLKRVFTEPQTFDVVMWLQGTAAVPYLEEGEIIDEESLQELWDAFGGNLFGFAAWFN